MFGNSNPSFEASNDTWVIAGKLPMFEFIATDIVDICSHGYPKRNNVQNGELYHYDCDIKGAFVQPGIRSPTLVC